MTCKDCQKYSKCTYKCKSIEDKGSMINWADWCYEFASVHKDRVIEKDGYAIIQSGYNWHTHIYDANGKMVFHAQTSKPMNKMALKKYLKRFLELEKVVINYE